MMGNTAQLIAEQHRQLCHADGSRCEDGCDRAPDAAQLARYMTHFCTVCRPNAECTCDGVSPRFWICSHCGEQNSRLDGECGECFDPQNHTCFLVPCPYCDDPAAPRGGKGGE